MGVNVYFCSCKRLMKQVILPKQVATWGELVDDIVPKALSKANNSRIASYNFRNVYFWDSVDVENLAGTALPSFLTHLCFYSVLSFKFEFD